MRDAPIGIPFGNYDGHQPTSIIGTAPECCSLERPDDFICEMRVGGSFAAPTVAARKPILKCMLYGPVGRGEAGRSERPRDSLCPLLILISQRSLR